MSEPPDNANNSLLSSLSVEEAAAALRVSGQTIRRRLKRGELRGEKIIGPTGSEWRVYRDGPLTPDPSLLAGVDAISRAVALGNTDPQMLITLQRLATAVERLTAVLEQQQAQQVTTETASLIAPAKKKRWWLRWVPGLR